MMEVDAEATRHPNHRQRVALFFSAMRPFRGIRARSRCTSWNGRKVSRSKVEGRSIRCDRPNAQTHNATARNAQTRKSKIANQKPKIELCEVGPRDGFQFEDRLIPTERKLRVIERLAEAGLRRLQVVSFVHPEWVPQMADAEDVAARLPEREGVVFSGLVLNEKGLERALRTEIGQIDLSIATNEQHSRDNANMPAEEAARQAERMTRTARDEGRPVQVGFQTVFGYDAPGDTPTSHVTDLAARFAELNVESLSLADTTGMAHPVMIRRRVEAVREAAPGVPLALHLHDTRGLGLANVAAGLEAGVGRFDAALAGMGGCPFIEGAAGNVATEDVTYLLESLGVETGVDFRRVAEVSKDIEAFLEKQFPGKIHRLLERGADVRVA